MQIERLPRASLEDLIASWPARDRPVEVPAESWITGRFELPGDVVVGESRPVWLVWTDQARPEDRRSGAGVLSARLRPRNSGLLRQDSHGPTAITGSCFSTTSAERSTRAGTAFAAVWKRS